MSESEWRAVGPVSTLSQKRCQRLHARLGKSRDLVLVCYQGNFSAMEAWCSHYGGPLDQGDIEDYKGSLHLMCPWHGYMFNLENGKSDTGLMQEVFETKVEAEQVFVKYVCDLQTVPFKQ